MNLWHRLSFLPHWQFYISYKLQDNWMYKQGKRTVASYFIMLSTIFWLKTYIWSCRHICESGSWTKWTCYSIRVGISVIRYILYTTDETYQLCSSLVCLLIWSKIVVLHFKFETVINFFVHLHKRKYHACFQTDCLFTARTISSFV